MKKACLSNATIWTSFRGLIGTNKVLILLMALLLVGGVDAFAQKKNVTKAKAKIVAEPRDTKAAKEAILLALEDSTTKNLASTWFWAGEVFYTIYNDQQSLAFSQPNAGDRALMGESLKKAVECYIKADSLDRLPDKKGRVKPKFSAKIVDRTLKFQKAFTDAGAYFYNKKEYLKAIDMFEQYMRYPHIPFLKGRGLEKDTLINTLKFNSAISAAYAKRMDIAARYFEELKDTIESEEDRKMIYANLSLAYEQLKDTANMLRIYQLGAKKYPREQAPNYSRNLINHYILKNSLDEALVWINESLRLEENSAPLWNLKGRILDKELEKYPEPERSEKLKEVMACYEKAIELDPNMADALGSIGRIFYNKAVEDLTKVNEIKDDKKYKAEKAKLKASFEKAKPYFEKAHKVEPTDKDYITALRGIYYNTGEDAKYKEMEELYNKIVLKK